MQGRLSLGSAAIVRRRENAIQQRVGLNEKANVVIRVQRHASYSLPQAVEVDAFVFRFGRLLVLILVFVFVLVFRGVILRFYGYLVALEGKRVLHVLAKSKRKDAPRAVRGEVELGAGDLRMELVVGQEIQAIALRVPGRSAFVERAAGHLAELVLLHTPYVKRRESGRIIHAEGQPSSAGRPFIVVYLTLGGVHNFL